MDSFFQFKERGTNVQTELLAGVTTFLTMAYIVFVNPGILAAAGVPFEGAATATALGAALMCLAILQMFTPALLFAFLLAFLQTPILGLFGKK
jgi:xanthine/uracil/vitamin C permease (AzgA family)